MSEILRGWLNQEVGLSRVVEDFERDFSNGFLLAELLHRYGALTTVEGVVDGYGMGSVLLPSVL